MTAPLKKDNLNVRIASDELELIKRAAEASGKSVSSFVIEAATISAQKALMDQRFFHLDGDLFESVAEAVSQPGRVHPKLAALLKNGGKWATSNR